MGFHADTITSETCRHSARHWCEFSFCRSCCVSRRFIVFLSPGKTSATIEFYRNKLYFPSAVVITVVLSASFIMAPFLLRSLLEDAYVIRDPFSPNPGHLMIGGRCSVCAAEVCPKEVRWLSKFDSSLNWLPLNASLVRPILVQRLKSSYERFKTTVKTKMRQSRG